jgi:hypothetical protein
MLVAGIKSKPVYAPLRADTSGRRHLLLGLAPGGDALLTVLDELRGLAPEALTRTQVLIAAQGASTASFTDAGVADVRAFQSGAALLAAFRDVLDRSVMGLRLYVAGPESFIGLAVQIALEFNLNRDEIRAQLAGSLARRVRCIHCRETTEDVRTNIVACRGCGRWLLVRDHYSRRLAAYMGVMVDAEAPGDRPPLQEVFP